MNKNSSARRHWRNSPPKASDYVKWSLRWGDKYDFLVEQDEKNQGKPDWKTPSAITDRPELEFHEELYLKDFYTLSSSRQSGMGLGAIPVSEILKFCEHFEIPDSDDFLYVIQKIDNAYLEFHRDKQEQEKPKDDGGKSKAVAALAAKGKGRK